MSNQPKEFGRLERENYFLNELEQLVYTWTQITNTYPRKPEMRKEALQHYLEKRYNDDTLKSRLYYLFRDWKY